MGKDIDFSDILDPWSSMNNALVLSVNILLPSILLFFVVHKLSAKNNTASFWSRRFSLLPTCLSILNGVFGIAYLSLAIWIICRRVGKDYKPLRFHVWFVVLCQGLTWLLLSMLITLKRLQLPCTRAAKFSSILVFFYSGFLCVLSVRQAVADKRVSVKVILDMLSFPVSILFLLCAFKEQKFMELDSSCDAYYELLHGEEPDATAEMGSDKKNVTPFARAGILSKLSFWWLDPLMKKGKGEVLDDEDIPGLWQAHQAKTCYSLYMEQVRSRKEKDRMDHPSVLSIMLQCHWKTILISGVFALIKVLALSTGPLFLGLFINIAEGKEAFKYEACVLALGLFLSKCLESLSERQWFFQTRTLGLQVRSLLSAAIYQKQLRLSNAAKMTHSAGEIVNYVTIDAYRIGEFPYWFHRLWSTCLQLFLALIIVYYSVGLASIAALVAITLTVLASSPLAKLQLKYQIKLMEAQEKRLKKVTEALANMKVLKLYAWEKLFKKVIDGLRKDEFNWISAVLSQKGYHLVLFWSSPVIVPAVTFWACYLFGIPLNASNVFTFMASLRIVQEPVRLIPEVFGVFIEAKVSLDRIVTFLEAPELSNKNLRKSSEEQKFEHSISIKATEISWETNSSSKSTLKNINFAVKTGDKVAICGEVGSGKSTLLAAVLGEVPKVDGIVDVHGKIAYVSQSAWIQTGSIQENILFGSSMDPIRYQQVLDKCCLVKDLEMLPFGDLTEIGERGVNLSGGQKQRIQLARALYKNADIYLLDDPFSALDAHTATCLFNEYVMGALSGKTVLLVTHQVDFLPVVDFILLMSAGEIIKAENFDILLESSQEFRDLVNAHKNTVGSEMNGEYSSGMAQKLSKGEIENTVKEARPSSEEQLIKKEERETGDTGLTPYIQYLSHNKGFLYFSLAILFHFVFIIGQLVQNYWLAANIQSSEVSKGNLIMVYTVIGCSLAFLLLFRSLFLVVLGCKVSQSIFSILMESLFRAPMSFYDSTPLGRILSRVSSDLSIIDLEVAYRLGITLGSIMISSSNLFILGTVAWPVVFLIIPMVYLSILLKRYYSASSTELVRIIGTTRSSIASYLTESITGAMTIRAFGEIDRFISKYLTLTDANASADFHNFSANEWLIQRLEILCAIVVSSSALSMTLLPLGASNSGFTGMALSYGLSLNVFFVQAIQFQCTLENLIISVERLEQYMHIPGEAQEVTEANRPMPNWPSVGKLEIHNLKVRYRPNTPLVLQGISCTIEGGQKIGIVGRTGSGKTTLISALFRLVESADGRIIIDGIDISKIGLHDLRSHLGIIPQDPTLFGGTVRYNLDPMSEHTDYEIWEVLEKCQLKEAVQQKEEGLNSLVLRDGSNWSMGQRQLFCLGRALLRRSKIVVLDEATASMDNTTDSILQKTIRKEFAHSTVITVAHRIPTVMDCNMVLGISDGKLVEYDEPLKLIKKEESLFGQLVKEFYSRSAKQ